MRLHNKTAIITGASRDIGRAIAIKFAREGANVVVNYCHSRENAEEVVSSIAAAGGQAVPVAADVRSAADVAKLIDETRKNFGDTIDIVVNNAGGLIARVPVRDMDEQLFDDVIEVNLKSTFLVCRAAIPHLAEHAAIINLSSIAGRDGGGPGAAAYATAKGAIMSLTRGLAKELGPDGIRVNCVCPGLIATSYHDRFSTDDARSKTAAATPLRREGNANEVADLVAYLASGEASFINGASIDINGGLLFS